MGDIYLARELVSERAQLVAKREYARDGQAYVSIAGRFLDQDFTDAAKPAIVGIYDRYIASIDIRLGQLGVVVD